MPLGDGAALTKLAATFLSAAKVYVGNQACAAAKDLRPSEASPCLVFPGWNVTKEERSRVSTVIRATEYLFLENIALKLVLQHKEVPHWEKLLDNLLRDKEILAGVRLKFRDIYDVIEQAKDPSVVLEDLAADLPKRRKVN